MATFDKFRSVYTHDELMERLCRIRHVALDMDGTIYMGMSLFPYTKPFLEGLKELGIGYSFLTNNPSKSIADYLHKLETLGIRATREEMYTTALATIDYIKEHYPAAKRLFLLGTPSMISEFEAAGFESAADSADDVPDVIVAAFDMTLQYDRLCRAAWWVSQGVPYIATNPFAPRPQARPDRHGRRPHLHRRGDGPQRQSDGRAGAFGRNNARRSRQSRSAAAHHRRQHRSAGPADPRGARQIGRPVSAPEAYQTKRSGKAMFGPTERKNPSRPKDGNRQAGTTCTDKGPEQPRTGKQTGTTAHK